MALKKVSDLSLQEFRFLVEKGSRWEKEMVELDIPKGFYLEVPEINILNNGEGFSAEYSPVLKARIFEGMEKHRKEKRHRYARQLEDIFYHIHRRQGFYEIQEKQATIMGWVARRQGEYLLTGDPHYLRDVHEANVCNGFREYGWTVPKVSKLLKNLSVRLPADGPFEGSVTFAKELVPGEIVASYRRRLEKQLAQGYFRY